jgi:quercetin dioxygenase-like cupin family protein
LLRTRENCCLQDCLEDVSRIVPEDRTMQVNGRSKMLPASVCFALVLAAVGQGTPDAAAQQTAATSAEALLGEIVEELGGRQIALTKLTVQPGAETMEHRHAAYLAVYVLSGQIESALDGKEPTLYGPGDVWYESYMQRHSTFRNPSSTEPFVGLIFAIRDADHPAVTASQADDH